MVRPMITVEYCQTMARYNAWQNKSLSRCFKALGMDKLHQDRGAFFGTLWRTGNHLLWGDQLWTSRFDGGQAPDCGMKGSTEMHDDLQLFLDDRLRTDQRIERWTGKLSQIDLVGPLSWQSSTTKKIMTRPKALCVMQLFNHQTHHRGQIHAMLTAAGQKPDATDLQLMPET